MNKTEVIAYEWLKKQGFNVSPMDNPDIVCDDGRGYEVKLLRGNQLWFSRKQMDELQKYPQEVDVLIFRDGDTEPYKIVPISKFLDVEYYEGMRIQIGRRIIYVNVTEAEHYLIKLAAISQGRTPSQWVGDTVRSWAKEETKNGSLDKWMDREYEHERQTLRDKMRGGGE